MGSYSKRCQAWFAQRFTHDPHAVGMRDHAEVRSQVRAAGTHSGADAGPVRTGGSHYRFATPMREPGGLPVIKSYGFQVEVSTVSQVPGHPHAAVNDHMKTTMPPPSASRSDLRFSQVPLRQGDTLCWNHHGRLARVALLGVYRM